MTVHVTPTIKTTDYPDFYAEVVRYAAYDLHSEAVPAFVDEEMDGLQ